ncbi:MAG: 4Fe-4S dicluster domain-containing protein [Promethearchaeota archaeon]
METEKVVKLSDLDVSLAEEFTEDIAFDLFACYQCGTCTGSCPVARFGGEEFSPRNIIRLITLGDRDAVLHNPLIWLCTNCYVCLERCPQDVKPPEVFVHLRNIAAKEDILPDAWPDIAANILTFGLMNEVGEYENKIRQSRFKLPELPKPDSDTMKKLAEKIKFDILVHFEEKSGEQD